MTRTTLVAVAFAALLATAGTVAAAPGNAPVDAGADNQYDDHAGAAGGNVDDAPADDDGTANASGDVPANGAAPDATAENADRRGPPADLPALVPDHVSTIHGLILIIVSHYRWFADSFRRTTGKQLHTLLHVQN
ncbi:MAG: hypothetical protein ABEH58_03090, partial [Haloplanus sp.]